MIQIITQLEGLYFTSMVPDIEVNCYDWLNFTLTRGGTEILKERYWANDKSRVWIRDLGKVMAADLGGVTGLAADYTLTVTDGNTTDTKIIRAILCEQRTEGTTAAYVENHFLTLLKGWKITRVWQKEILSIYSTTQVDVTIEVVKKDGTRTGPDLLRTITETNQVVEMEVSASRILLEPHATDRYIIKAGNRMMTYYVKQDVRAEEHEILFRNAFGCRESFVATGLIERKNEYENTTGYVRDMLFRFRTKETKKFTCNTGILDLNHSDWAEDMIVSTEVFLLIGSDLFPITITDAKVVRTNAPEELISFEVDYQLSKPNIYGAGKIDIKRIFDDTFDYTFH